MTTAADISRAASGSVGVLCLCLQLFTGFLVIGKS